MIPEAQLEELKAHVLQVNFAAGAVQGVTLLLAAARARATAIYVNACGGNQSEAARRLGIDQGAISRMVNKDRTDASLDWIDLVDATERLNSAIRTGAASLAFLETAEASGMTGGKADLEYLSIPAPKNEPLAFIADGALIDNAAGKQPKNVACTQCGLDTGPWLIIIMPGGEVTATCKRGHRNQTELSAERAREVANQIAPAGVQRYLENVSLEQAERDLGFGG